LDGDYDYPAAVDSVRNDLATASEQLLAGLTGAAKEELAAANAVNLRMAPLTPDHHFYIDQGSNARLRVVLIMIGRRLTREGFLKEPDDVMYLRYDELRQLIGDPAAHDVGRTVEQRRAERAAAHERRPRDWVGTVTESQLNFPYWVNWGYPDRFYRGASANASRLTGIGGSPGAVEGSARVVLTTDDFDDVANGDILVCQMTNPAWVVLFTKISGLVTDSGGMTSHPAVLAREFGIPAVAGTSEATHRVATGDRLRVDGTNGTVDIVVRSTQRPDAAELPLT
jgi:phosphohistidine swiveling domain-containing protein